MAAKGDSAAISAVMSLSTASFSKAQNPELTPKSLDELTDEELVMLF